MGHASATYGRSVITVAVIAAIGYFAVFGAGFLVRPELVERFALRWTDPAGKTEVRCYYGAVSLAIAGFLTYLAANDLAREALVGVLVLASAVFATRVIGAAVDAGRDHPYARMAIPVEAGFVIAVGLVLLLG